MTTEHTPGLWEVGHDGSGAPIITFEARDIATVEAYYKDAEANARLIAAAPELLDTLKLLFEDWVTLVGDDCEDNEDVRRIWQACQDALTKATGEPVMAA
jgi:geranylgeranyl pyrophosphate synthase